MEGHQHGPGLEQIRADAEFRVYAIKDSPAEVRTSGSVEGVLHEVRVHCGDATVTTYARELHPSSPPEEPLQGESVVLRVDGEPNAFVRVEKGPRSIAVGYVGDVRITVGAPSGSQFGELTSA